MFYFVFLFLFFVVVVVVFAVVAFADLRSSNTIKRITFRSVVVEVRKQLIQKVKILSLR